MYVFPPWIVSHMNCADCPIWKPDGDPGFRDSTSMSTKRLQQTSDQLLGRIQRNGRRRSRFCIEPGILTKRMRWLKYTLDDFFLILIFIVFIFFYVILRVWAVLVCLQARAMAGTLPPGMMAERGTGVFLASPRLSGLWWL